MSYDIESELVFKPPKFNQKTLRHYMNANDHLLKKIEKNLNLNKQETIELRYLPSVYLLGYLNGFDDSIEKLESAKAFIKAKSRIAYKKYKDAIRALRKIKYN